VIISGSRDRPVRFHFARLAQDFGAHVLAVTTRADSTLAGLAEAVIVVPTYPAGSGVHCSSRGRCCCEHPTPRSPDRDCACDCHFGLR